MPKVIGEHKTELAMLQEMVTSLSNSLGGLDERLSNSVATPEEPSLEKPSPEDIPASIPTPPIAELPNTIWHMTETVHGSRERLEILCAKVDSLANRLEV